LPPTSSGPGRQSQNQDFGNDSGNGGGAAYEQKSRRPEMRGPSADVSDMMSRLKTKTINIQQSAGPANAADITLTNILSGMGGGGGSNSSSNDLANVISVTDLGDIPADSTPHKSKRRPRSERNTVSLDL